MNQDEIDIYSLIQRILSQWKILVVFNLVTIIFVFFLIGFTTQVHKTKIQFSLNPSFKSDVSYQVISALYDYAELEPSDFEDKYQSYVLDYKNFNKLTKEIYSAENGKFINLYDNLKITEDRNKQKFLEIETLDFSALNNKLIYQIHSNANSLLQGWLINLLKDIKLSFETEVENKIEVHNLLIDKKILEAKLNLESQIISYLAANQLAINELQSAKGVAESLNYYEPAVNELYTIFNSQNLNVPSRLKIDEKRILGEGEKDMPISSYSIANISGIPLFLFGVKLLDSEIIKLKNEKDDVDNLFPKLRSDINLLEKTKSPIFIEEIQEDLVSVRSLNSVIIKLEKFITNTDYSFIYANKNKIETSSYYPNFFKGLIVILISFFVSILIALYNSERLRRNEK